jgi:signal transduction histidine kinase
VPRIRQDSISRRLTRMNMLVSGGALLLATLVFSAYALVTFRDDVLHNLSTQAQIVASNSVTALLFNDADTAHVTLSALEAEPGIVDAHIYTVTGQLFASYWRDGATGIPQLISIPPERQEIASLGRASAIVTRKIVSDGMPAGTVYIRSDLHALYARLWRGGLIAAGVLLGSWLAALFVSRRAQRTIADPLIELAAIAHRVSNERDYAVRAQRHESDHEVTTLVEAFNDMLAQIQARDRALQEAQASLEQHVRERTAALQSANEELEAFSYSVSHDLRAPLRHVTGFASLLQEQAGSALDAKARRYLATITEAAGRMGTLIDDLLAFSRMGRTNVAKRHVNLSELVREARAEVAAGQAGRRIEWNVKALPMVEADQALLRLVLVNLLSNAVKYTSTRVEARIEVGTMESAGHEVVVFVRDNGVGFDMAYAHKLFGVFQRLHRSDEFSGTGIGLANVRRIVQRHGGRTWAEGAVDAGATFFFSLPMGADSSMGVTNVA